MRRVLIIHKGHFGIETSRNCICFICFTWTGAAWNLSRTESNFMLYRAENKDGRRNKWRTLEMVFLFCFPQDFWESFFFHMQYIKPDYLTSRKNHFLLVFLSWYWYILWCRPLQLQRWFSHIYCKVICVKLACAFVICAFSVNVLASILLGN